MISALISFSLISFGFYWFLNYSELTEWLRRYLSWEGDKDESGWIPFRQRQFLKRLIGCSFCTSYHCGWALGVLFGFGWKSFIYAFGVAVLSYFWSLAEKILLKKLL